MNKIEKPISKRVEPMTIEGYNEISNVLYRGEKATYRIYDELTKPRNIYELAELFEKEKKAGNPIPANSELLQGIFKAINPADEYLIQRIRQTLRDNIWTNTLTGIDWYKNNNSRVFHNKGTSEQYIKKGNLIGRDGYISKIKPKKILKNVLGNDNIEELDNVSQKINEAPMCLWRINSKLSENIETIVRFDAFPGRFDLYCGRSFLYRYPAFRIQKVD